MKSANCAGCDGCRENSFGWKKIFSAVLVAIVVVGVLLFVSAKGVLADEDLGKSGCVNWEEIEHELEEREKCLVVVEGKVYDFTDGAKMWDLDGHVGQHLCGREYAPEIIEIGPHGVEVIDKFYFSDLCGGGSHGEGDSETVLGLPKVFGITWRRLSSWLALLFFFLNFATCYAMPWARGGAPWAGERPGKDKKDKMGHFPLTYWHGYFAWLAIFSLTVHGLLLFACVLLGKCF